jgi:hypothetical protein
VILVIPLMLTLIINNYDKKETIINKFILLTDTFEKRGELNVVEVSYGDSLYLLIENLIKEKELINDLVILYHGV